MPDSDDPLLGLAVWDRGWLSSTQVLVAAAPGEEGALLFDSAHALHAGQTLALVEAALAGQPLQAVVNTHLHSDHCGGNAALQQRFGCEAWVPQGQAQVAIDWDERQLSHGQTQQLLPRFTVHRALQAGTWLRAGGRDWQLLAAPGHDPDALMLWDGRVLVAGDALWEQGFGVVFGEFSGPAGFEDALAVLDRIEALAPQVVIPGHGPALRAVPVALQQARQRLAGWQRQPASHQRYAAKVLIKYHLMECRRQPLPAVLDWLQAVPLLVQMEHRPQPLRDWGLSLIEELVSRGALRRDGDWLLDAG